MKVMILAAGVGSRLRPLTNDLPKALVEVHGRPIIEYHLHNLAKNGFKDIIINVSYLADKIKKFIGNGHAFDVNVEYSEEKQPLETGGGIFNALPLLGDKPFLAVNADILTDYPFCRLQHALTRMVHCVLVKTQAGGDFGLHEGLLVNNQHDYTYSGIAVYSPQLFTHCQAGKFSVTPLIKQAIIDKQVTGELYHGQWHDIGTMEQLQLVQ